MVEIKPGIDPKKYFPDTEHIIDYAFTVGKHHYFKYNDHLNIPAERALATLVYYREVELNITSDFLKEHLQAIDKILHATTIDVYKIKSLNDQLLQRLELPKDPQLLYKLASIVYFDQHEKPQVYEWEYNKKKISYWKEAVSLKDFFSQRPLKELIPYLEFADENLEAFSQIIQDVNKIHSDNLSAISLDKQKT